MAKYEWDHYKDKRIIGFCGYKGVGKSEAAKALEGYTDVQFSGALKAMLRAYLEYNNVENTDLYTDGWYKNQKSRYFCNKEFRHAMQSLGTEWGRNMIGTDLWLNSWTNKIQGLDRITVSDVRFPDEVLTIKEKGGIIIRIRRPAYLNEDNHVSEKNMEKLDADYEIVNTTISALRKDIRNLESFHFDGK